MSENQDLPSWAEELRLRYIAGESSLFLLHGNVRDLYPWKDESGKVDYLDLQSFLSKFLGRSKNHVLYYNISDGLSTVGKGSKSSNWPPGR